MAKYGLTEQGPNPKRLDVILDEMHDDLTKYTGKNTRQNPQSFLNHYLTNVADAIAELWEFGTAIYHSQYPSQRNRSESGQRCAVWRFNSWRSYKVLLPHSLYGRRRNAHSRRNNDCFRHQPGNQPPKPGGWYDNPNVVQ